MSAEDLATVVATRTGQWHVADAADLLCASPAGSLFQIARGSAWQTAYRLWQANAADRPPPICTTCWLGVEDAALAADNALALARRAQARALRESA